MTISIQRNPPCAKDCPERCEDCHARCEKYRAWRARLDEISKERRKHVVADQDAYGMAFERKEWLRRRGYKT